MNVATEDVLYMLNGMGINNGINLKVLAASKFILIENTAVKQLQLW